MYSKIIGLDLSLASTGVCTYNEGVYTTDTIKYKLPKKATDHQKYLRRTYIKGAIKGLVIGFEPEYAVIESLSFKSFDQYNERAGLYWWCTDYLRDNDISFKELPPATLKKWATEKGNADKQLMVDTCNSKYGTSFTLKENDLCDAYLLVKWGLNNG